MITLCLILSILLLASISLFIVFPAYADKSIVQHKSFIALIIISLSIIVPVLYYILGDSRGVYNKILWDQLEDESQAQHAKLHIPEKLIMSLQTQLRQHPHNSLNWVLLGRIYFAAQDYHDAAQAFGQAYLLYPHDPDILAEYASSLYMAGENSGVTWDDLIMQVRALSPPTTMSLGLLANIALAEGDKEKAISYWKEILLMLPPNSPLYQALQKTITQVQDTGNEK